MKKFFMIAVMAVAALTASAQSNACQDEGTLSIKPYVGLSEAMLLNKNNNSDMRTGLTAGVEFQYMTSEWFGLSFGAGYSQQGGKGKNWIMDGLTLTDKFDYVNIPVLANFYVCKGLALKIGVQPGFLVSKKITATYASTSVDLTKYENTENLRKFDVAIPIGISYEFSQVVLDARINVGMVGIDKSSESYNDYNPKNGVFQFTLGYRF